MFLLGDFQCSLKWQSSIWRCKKQWWSLGRFSQIWLLTTYELQIFNQPLICIFMATLWKPYPKIWRCFTFFLPPFPLTSGYWNPPKSLHFFVTYLWFRQNKNKSDLIGLFLNWGDLFFLGGFVSPALAALCLRYSCSSRCFQGVKKKR